MLSDLYILNADHRFVFLSYSAIPRATSETILNIGISIPDINHCILEKIVDKNVPTTHCAHILTNRFHISASPKHIRFFENYQTSMSHESLRNLIEPPLLLRILIQIWG